MKLESILLRRPGTVHVAPVLDIVLLLLAFFLLASSFTLHSGFQVDVPESPSALRPLMGRSHVVLVSAGLEPRILLNDEEVTLVDLGAKLEEQRGEGNNVVIRGDKLAGFGRVVEIANIAASRGFSVAFAASPPEVRP